MHSKYEKCRILGQMTTNQQEIYLHVYTIPTNIYQNLSGPIWPLLQWDLTSVVLLAWSERFWQNLNLPFSKKFKIENWAFSQYDKVKNKKYWHKNQVSLTLRSLIEICHWTILTHLPLLVSTNLNLHICECKNRWWVQIDYITYF